MNKIILAIVVLTFCIKTTIVSAQSRNLESHKEVLLLMGTRFEITAISENKKLAKNAVNQAIQEIQRIEALISSWKKDSQTTMINENAGIAPVVIDLELFNLIERACKVSKLTGGAFDISFASIESIYKFDKKEHHLPNAEERERSVAKINWQKIQLNREKRSVFLLEKGMKIGFGGIGKGYAANKGVQIMRSLPGIRGTVVNASGDLMTWGENGRDEGWSIQISDPLDPERSIGQLTIDNASVVTSGDYEKYFTSEGNRYAHIINPFTGLPTTGIKSSTIICPDAELGDAIATSIFVLGIEKGLELVDNLKNVEALIVSDGNEVFTSKHLKINKIKI